MPMFTWSLGCTGVLEPSTPPNTSIARLEMTSFTFMFVWVPEPVWKMTWTCRTGSRTVRPQKESQRKEVRVPLQVSPLQIRTPHPHSPVPRGTQRTRGK